MATEFQTRAREIDTRLAKLYELRAREVATIRSARTTLERVEAGKMRLIEYQVESYRARLAAAELERDRLSAEIAALDAVFAEMGGWNRYFLVQNTNGHVHRGMHCTTCYADTQYAWLIDLAAATEQEMVAEFGEIACTVCFPEAPSEYARLKAAGLLTANERRTQAERDAVAAEKAAKAAAKDAKAITAADGSTLRTRRAGTIRTLVTARNELTGTLAYAIELAERAEDRHAGLLAELAADAELLTEAIAAKTGETVEAVRAEHEAKAVKKAARDKRESEKHAKRLGLL